MACLVGRQFARAHAEVRGGSLVCLIDGKFVPLRHLALGQLPDCAFDVSTPTAPDLKGHLDLPDANDVVIVPPFAYVTQASDFGSSTGRLAVVKRLDHGADFTPRARLC